MVIRVIVPIASRFFDWIWRRKPTFKSKALVIMPCSRDWTILYACQQRQVTKDARGIAYITQWSSWWFAKIFGGKKEAHYAGRYSMALFSTAIWIGQRRELFLIFLLFHFSHLEERVLASQHLLTSIINGGDARCPRRRRSSEEQKFFPTKNIASGQMLEIIFCM